jgi:hypothetical protein
MSQQLVSGMETPKTNPYLPKEVRAVIYKHLGGPKTIKIHYVFGKRDVTVPRHTGWRTHRVSKKYHNRNYYITSHSLPPVGFGIESWSRTLALEEGYVQLLPRTKFQLRPVSFRPSIDVVEISHSFFRFNRWEFNVWDSSYGDWHWHFAMMDKIDNLNFVITESETKDLENRIEINRRLLPRPAFYGEEGFRVLRVKMSFDYNVEKTDFGSPANLEHTKFRLERDIVLYYNKDKAWWIRRGMKFQPSMDRRKIIFDWGSNSDPNSVTVSNSASNSVTVSNSTSNSVAVSNSTSNSVTVSDSTSNSVTMRVCTVMLDVLTFFVGFSLAFFVAFFGIGYSLGLLLDFMLLD